MPVCVIHQQLHAKLIVKYFMCVRAANRHFWTVLHQTLILNIVSSSLSVQVQLYEIT